MKNRNRKRRFIASIESMEGRCLLSAVPHYTVQDLGVSNIGILPNGFPMSVSLSPTGSATGIAVNNSGQITGTSTPPPGVYAQNHAFFYSGGVMTDITPGAWTGEGVAINNSGQVAGVESPLNGYEQAFVTGPNGTGFAVISGKGSNSGFAYSINSSGDVVGRASIPGLGTEGFLYKDRTFYDLNDLLDQPTQGLLPGDHIAQAYSINDSGQILAIGNGTERYLLTPVPQPVTPTITWSNPADITYGTPLSATQLNATASVPGTFTYSVPAGTVLHAGAAQSLVATFTPDDTVDYTTVTATALINVTPRPVWVYANPMGNPITKAYGATPPDVTVTYLGQNDGSPFVNGDTPESLGLHVALHLDTTLDSSTPVGTYEGSVYITYNPTNGHPNDYGFNGTGIMVIVTPAPLTVTANNATKIQGQANPPLSGTIVGLVNGDTDTTTYSTTATTSSPAGSYPITPTLVDRNYSITYVNGILSVTNVTPMAPVVTWANPADITYGTALGPAQLNATANVPGTFTYSIPQGTMLHAGAAQVIQATFTPDDLVNYTTVTTMASINVLKAPLTVTASNALVRYGFPIPPLTGTITGLVNGDTDVATYTTTAVRGSWAGYYPIVPHLTDPNYNITFVNGTLTIYWSVPPAG